MTEMALTADHLIIIGRGRLLSRDRWPTSSSRAPDTTSRWSRPTPTRSVGLLRDKGAVVTVDGPEELSVQGLESRDIGILASGAGLTLYELSTQRASLEDAFMELTHEHAEYQGTTQTLEASQA